MKSIQHSGHIFWGWLWWILGAMRAVARAGESGEVLFFCQVNNERLYRFSVRQISRNLNTIRWSVSWWILSAQNFENFPVRGRFFQKMQKLKLFQHLATSGRHNSAMITDRRKFSTKWSLYWMSSFHFYRRNQFKVIPLACALCTRNLSPIFLRRQTRVDLTADNAHINQSQTASDDGILSHVTLGRVKCRK